MEASNKLIAEFMEVHEIMHDGYSEYDFADNTLDVVHEDDLQYHTSWDWLMPVVQKIGDEYLNTPFDETYSHLTEQYENIWTIEDTYKAVVEFIKNQNN